MVGDNADALVNRSLIVDLIGAVKVPALFPFLEFVDVGGLMAHSYDLMGLVKIIANDIDDPARRKPRRYSLPSVFQIRIVDQPQDRQGD